MSEETMKVLSMLEQGKVTPEEAEKLLEVLSNSRPSPKNSQFPHQAMMMSKNLMKKIERIPEIINAKMASEAKVADRIRKHEKNRYEEKGIFKDVRTIAVNQFSGDMKVAASSDGTTLIHGEEDMKIINVKGAVTVNAVDSDMNIMIPNTVPMAINTMNGDMEILGMKSRLNLQIYNGDLRAVIHGGIINAQLLSGDVDFKATKNISGKISILSGDADITIPENADMTLIIRIQNGEIENDTENQAQIKKSGKAIFVFGTGESALKIISQSGDIRLSTMSVDSIEDEIADIEDEIADIEDDVADIEDNVADIEDEVADIQDIIIDVEDELNDEEYIINNKEEVKKHIKIHSKILRDHKDKCSHEKHGHEKEIIRKITIIQDDDDDPIILS